MYGTDWQRCYGWYRVYVASNYHTLPFPGALSEQPRWVEDNFTTFSLIEQWLDAFSDAPSAGNLGDWTEMDI